MTRDPRTIVETLRLAMETAAAKGDFEEAAILRDRISLMRGTSDATDPSQLDISGLRRQQPGAMGLGTSRQSVTPPADWVRPKKPDPMTAGSGKTRTKRKV